MTSVKGLSSKNKEEGFASHIEEVARENEKFLKEKAKESFGEVVELINDAINYATFITKRKEIKEEYANLSMIPFIVHILMPFSYGISTDLLVGNLPACFYELRMMLESIAICYISDLHPDKDLFFEIKLLSLEKVLKKEKVSTSKLLEDFGKMVELENEPLKLWGKISQDWIHTTGIAKKIVEQVVEKSELPPYALVLPMSYSEADLDIIKELGKRVSDFTKILKTTMDKYKEEKLAS